MFTYKVRADKYYKQNVSRRRRIFSKHGEIWGRGNC